MRPNEHLRVHLNRRESVRVASFAEAARTILEYIRRNDLGSSGFYSGPSAGLIDRAGRIVANVSYNGRVWQGSDRFATNQTEITTKGA